MSVAVSPVVALLILGSMDDHFNDARHPSHAGYDKLAFASGQVIWLGNYEPGTNRYFSGFAPANA
jgi:hypothetical protein